METARMNSKHKPLTAKRETWSAGENGVRKLDTTNRRSDLEAKKTSHAPGNEKPDTRAAREKTPVRLTEKGKLYAKEFGVESADLLIGLLGQVDMANRKGTDLNELGA